MISISEIKWNKVHQSNFSLTLTDLTDKVLFMASNFSVIPIRWLLTVDSGHAKTQTADCADREDQG